jgi:hypothetical protein
MDLSEDEFKLRNANFYILEFPPFNLSNEAVVQPTSFASDASSPYGKEATITIYPSMLPKSIDYRNFPNAVSSIKDQGPSYCGGWAFAATGLYESFMMF